MLKVHEKKKQKQKNSALQSETLNLFQNNRVFCVFFHQSFLYFYLALSIDQALLLNSFF